MSEWISVKDRLPEEDVIVLVFIKNEGFTLAIKYKCDDFFEEHMTCRDVWPTHWMELPDAPTTE